MAEGEQKRIMSHFSVLVTLPVEHVIEADFDYDSLIQEVLAPYDENDRVEPYKKYFEGSPRDYWYIERLVLNENLREYEKPLTQEEADQLSWTDVVELYNKRFSPNNQLAVPTDIDDEDDDLDRPLVDDLGAFIWSDYNPKSKWDWHVIGGRWMNYFPTTVSVTDRDTEKFLVHGQPGTFGTKYREFNIDGKFAADGGPRGVLDFSAMRAIARNTANTQYDVWESVLANTPALTTTWEQLVERVKFKEIDFDQARSIYGAQPRIKYIRQREVAEALGTYWSDTIERFDVSREEFVTRAHLASVPGFALVTKDGQWLEPGKMGWFGVSTDSEGSREAYHIEANRYLEELDPKDYVICVDCHI